MRGEKVRIKIHLQVKKAISLLDIVITGAIVWLLVTTVLTVIGLAPTSDPLKLAVFWSLIIGLTILILKTNENEAHSEKPYDYEVNEDKDTDFYS